MLTEFDPNAPDRMPEVFPSSEDFMLTVLHAVYEAIDFAGIGFDRRYDYFCYHARVAFGVRVTKGNPLVTVEYSSPVLDEAMGAAAFRLSRLLKQDITVRDFAFTFQLEPERQFSVQMLGPLPAFGGLDASYTYTAEGELRDHVGKMVDIFRNRADPTEFMNTATSQWNETAYGVVSLNGSVQYTTAPMPSEVPNAMREQYVGELRLRLAGGGRDLLMHMIDLAAFARKHGLVLVEGPDAMHFWTFRFVNLPRD